MARALPGHVRGLAYQLCENLGTLARNRDEMGDIRLMLHALRRYGVWFGRRNVFLPALLKPEAARLLFLLRGIALRIEHLPPAPLSGITSFAMEDGARMDLVLAAGFRVVGGRAIRLDMLERLEKELEKGAAAGTPAETLLTKLVSLLGSDRPSLDRVLAALGWHQVAVEGEILVTVLRRHARPPRSHRRERPLKPPALRTNSPFAELAVLVGK